MTLERYLDKFEASLSGCPVVFKIEYEGDVDVAALSRAFNLLCAQHPILRGRVQRREGRYLLTVSSRHQPELTVCDNDGRGDSLRDVTERWNIERSVVEIVLRRGQDGGFVELYIDHLIGDGRNAFALIDDLWILYSDIVNASGKAIWSRGQLPSSPLEILSRRLKWNLPISSPYSVDRSPLFPSIHRRIQLTIAETDRLVSCARASATSVHGLICGAILISQRAHLDCQQECAPMILGVPVDLRSRVKPTVGATETTNFAIPLTISVSVPINGDAVILGCDVKAQLDSAIANDEPQIAMRRMLEPVPARLNIARPEQRLAAAVISNVGVIPPFAQADAMRITDFQIGRYDMPSPYPLYAAYTYAGRLSILSIYRADLYATEEVDCLIELIIEQLRTVDSPVR